MSNYVKLINNLEVLQLEKIKQNLDQYIDLINNKKKDIVEALYELTNLEIELRNKWKTLYLYILHVEERRKEQLIIY